MSFLTQVEWDGFGRYAETPPDRQTLERFFFLDDADQELVDEPRGAHSRLGFAVQLVTVRHVGRFLPDPLDVPTSVVDYLAAQLHIDDAFSVKRYLERRNDDESRDAADRVPPDETVPSACP